MGRQGLLPRRHAGRSLKNLKDLVAADRAEYGPSSGRSWQEVPHWSRAELRVAERYARAVLTGRYSNAVLAVKDCRAALARVAGGSPRKAMRPPVRSRKAVHAMLVKAALRLGRTRSRARWRPGETAILDRFAKAVAGNRFRTAREAGPACRDAITTLHRRFPAQYAGIPERSLSTIQHELWPRVAKLKFRWFNSHWSAAELALADRYTRLLVAHRFPHVSAASRACCEAINRLHARLARKRGRKQPGIVRTLPGVFDQILTRAKELAPFQIPHRRWVAEEHRIAARWTRKHDQHMRGKLTMNLFTIASLLQGELDRKGYYRNVQACVTEIVTRRREGSRRLKR